MQAFVFGLILAIVVSIVLMWVVSTYNSIQKLLIKINEAEANIDIILRRRFDLLTGLIVVIKENTDKKNPLSNIEDLKSKKISNFELDRELISGLNEIKKYNDRYPNLNKNEDYSKSLYELNETESEITACRKYYNENITKYNKIIKSFPSLVIAKMAKNKPKPYYDGKNMEDDITNDFKL